MESLLSGVNYKKAYVHMCLQTWWWQCKGTPWARAYGVQRWRLSWKKALAGPRQGHCYGAGRWINLLPHSAQRGRDSRLIHNKGSTPTTPYTAEQWLPVLFLCATVPFLRRPWTIKSTPAQIMDESCMRLSERRAAGGRRGLFLR